MSSLRAVCLSLLVLLGGLFAPAALVTPATAQSSPSEMTADNTVIRVQVHEDGSATWTLQTRVLLETDDELDSFREYKRTYQDNASTHLDAFKTRMTTVVSEAHNATSREMNATNFTTDIQLQQVPRQWGIITFSFTWGGFANQTSEGLLVSDVFAGGFYLSESDSLEIYAPTDHTINFANPTPDSKSDQRIVWTGRTDFADQRPRIMFENAATPGNHTPPGDGNHTGNGTLVFLGLVGLGIVGGGAYLYRQKDAETEEETPTDEDLLTDNERVLGLIKDNGGRMKQAKMNDHFDWSKSKTSLILNDLEEAGHIEKTRLGRENLVSLVEDGREEEDAATDE